MGDAENIAAERWNRLSKHEIERRHSESMAAMRAIERKEFDVWYQAICDKTYWSFGPCCSGCDHWVSSGGDSGLCEAAGIVSGGDVLRSLDIEFSSYIPPPGLPYTEARFYCGKFSDAFDWYALDQEYLESIGAMRGGRLREKPTNEERSRRASPESEVAK